jgi:hypothetical protein
VTWHRGLAWAAACITGILVVAASWLTIADLTVGHLLVWASSVVLAVVPAASGTIVSKVPRTGVLGPLLVLPGLLAALVLTLMLAEDVLPSAAGADYVTVASQGAWVLVFVVVALPLLLFPAPVCRVGCSRSSWPTPGSS